MTATPKSGAKPEDEETSEAAKPGAADKPQPQPAAASRQLSREQQHRLRQKLKDRFH